MMILHDGHGKFLEIEMIGSNGISWEHDFFELKSDENDIHGDDPFFNQLKEPYKKKWNEGIIHFVDDVEYCLEQAYDCQNHEGDFADITDTAETEVFATIYDFNDIVI